MASYIIFAIFLVAVVALLPVFRVGHRGKGLPPGPPTLPIIGNLHLMPQKDAHIQFSKWADEYGPIYSLILGTQVMVVLSSGHVVKDLLDKRSAIYSSRPEMFLGQDIVSGGLRMVLMKYGDTWRMLRKMFHTLLNTTAVQAYSPYVDLENKQMLVGFLEQPNLWIQHLRRYTNSLTTQMIFGFRTTSIDDPKLKHLYEGFEKWCEITGSQSAALLDVFPILRKLPRFMIPRLKYAEELHRREAELYIGHWLDAKARIKNGTAKPCFCIGIAKAQQEEKFSDRLAGYTSGTALEAGSDTTAATLVGFVQAIILHPEVQEKALEEIERVCGERLPDVADAKELPYVRACVKETIRWMPAAILGIPHSVIRDDEYMGYRIPKGANIILNVWGINMDPERHVNPEIFDPLRYINDSRTLAEGAMDSDSTKRDFFIFGAGRRVCQGMHVAERSLFISMARLLWAFKFEKAIGTDGKEITPDRYDIIEGVIAQPRPFPARITPRSTARAKLVEEAWEACQSFLDEEKQWKEVPEGKVYSEYDPGTLGLKGERDAMKN